MAATATDYASLSEFKKRINKTVAQSTDSDDVYQDILNSAAALVDKLTRNPPQGATAFSATSSTSAVRLFDHVLRDDGHYPIDDNLAVTAVSIGGTAIDGSYYKLYPLNPGTGPYTSIYIRQDATNVTGAGTVWYQNGVGHAQLSLTGTWGYCTLANRPPEIKEATIRQALRMYEYQNLGKTELSSMMVNPYKELDPIVYALLEPYMKSKGKFRIA